MNLITSMLVLSIVLDFKINLINGAYKKRRNEHCSLQVNSLCYDDELNDKPIKIVHDENGVKSVLDADQQSTGKKKNRKKISTDVIQPKVSRQISTWETLARLRLFARLNNQFNRNANLQNHLKPTSTPFNRSQHIDRSKLIFKFHKLNNVDKLTVQQPATITISTTENSLFNQRPTLSSPLTTVSYPATISHLNKFKTINRPLLSSSSYQNAAILGNNFESLFRAKNKFSYPLTGPFVNSLTLQLPDYYADNPNLITENSLSNYLAYNSFLRKPTTTTTITTTNKLGSNHLPKNLSFYNNYDHDHKTTTTAPTWQPTHQTTDNTNSPITEPLPTNLTNYINLRESGHLKSYQSGANESTVYNTTQDRIWTDEDQNDVFSTKPSPFDQFTTSSFENRTKLTNLFSDSDKYKFESTNSLELDRPGGSMSGNDFATTPHSAEESSKEEIDTFKFSNQLDNHPNEFDTTKDNYFAFNSKEQQQTKHDLGGNDSREKEFDRLKEFESTQPLSQQHKWPTQLDHHNIDELLANSKLKGIDADKSTNGMINYLTDDKDDGILTNQNYPIFYPNPNNKNGPHATTAAHKPTYTIIQTKDKNKDKLKRYAKLITKIAVEEAKRFKKNELDTFLKRKKLIVDRYRPNDMYQKAIAAKYVWKKISLDFLSLLGYQIANYLGPLNSKHWMKHSNLFDESKSNDDQLKAIEHILKDQNLYYQIPPSTNLNQKYVLNSVGDHAFSDYFNSPPTHQATTDQFLNDDSFFNQNYFKMKEHDDQPPSKLLSTEEPMMSGSVTSDQTTKIDSLQPAILKKDKNLNNEFLQNQILNNKLLANQLNNDEIIDFRTKEQLQQVFKPIKITPSE